MRIEADHARCISHEVRKRIDVVIQQRAVAIVDDVLDSPDVDLRSLSDPLHRSDYIERWLKLLHLQTRTRCIDWTRDAGEFNSVGGLADVGGAEIESLAGSEDFDRVKIFAAECFDSRDVSTARRDELLDQRRLIDTEIEPVVLGGGNE